MHRSRFYIVGYSASVLILAAMFSFAQNKPAVKDYEKQVKEAEVPKAALYALKKMSGGVAFTEFAEEVEHGQKFYEGSWKGPDGNVDGLVTEAGDIVELEEEIPAAKVPEGARAAIEKEAGKDAVQYEKKTIYLYEAHFKKDGKGREVIVTADGREFHEEGGKDGEKEADEDDEK